MKNDTLVTFTVHADTDAHVRTEQAIRDEVRSWLESLRATIRTVTVRSEGKK